LGGNPAVSPHQAARAQLDAAKPAYHQDSDLIALLAIQRLQNRTSRRPAGLTIVIEAVFLPNAVSPAIMSGVGDLVFCEKRQGLSRRAHWSRQGEKAALLDGFFVSGDSVQCVCHR